MVRVTVGSNLERKNVIVAESTTLRQILEDAEIDYSRGNFQLDGATLRPGDMDKTLADFGIKEACFLIGVAKMDNA